MIKKDDKFLSDMRKRYELALEANSDNRDRAIDDERFVTIQGEHGMTTKSASARPDHATSSTDFGSTFARLPATNGRTARLLNFVPPRKMTKTLQK